MLNRSRFACLRPGAVLALAASLLGGCSSIDPSVYADQTPKLDLREYFNGTVDAWGVFTDRSGKVVKRFTVVMRCNWKTIDGVETGVLDEDFSYSDGTRQKRVWTVRKMDDRYVGTAADVVGEANGKAAGNALRWRYTLALPVDGRVWQVQFDDWMFLMNREVMINRAAMSKFGIHLGDVTLSFRKRGV
ncbi:MAG TPA: DUF3833 domain-containing protein [Pseudogulbenkiania sp.]|nr:DUF3833 domain-containing protein [Pseudogulbenkiania sp.]